MSCLERDGFKSIQEAIGADHRWSIKHEQEQTTERIESPFLTTTKTKELYLNFIDSVVSFCLNNNIDGFCFSALALWEITKQQFVLFDITAQSSYRTQNIARFEIIRFVTKLIRQNKCAWVSKRQKKSKSHKRRMNFQDVVAACNCRTLPCKTIPASSATLFFLANTLH